MRWLFLGRAKFHLSRFDLVFVLEPRMDTDDHGWDGMLLNHGRHGTHGMRACFFVEGEVPSEPV
jgi:hypothetical protein